MAKSIGDLHATITANAVQFVSEFQRADAAAKQSAASINKTLGQQFGDELGKTGKKFALGFLGAAAIGKVVSELKDVATNIDRIPGVPGETISSIQEMNYLFAQSKTVVDRAAATTLDWFSKLGSGIGLALGGIVYGSDTAGEAMNALNKEAQEFARAGFNKQIAELTDEFNRLSLTDKSKIIADLDQEAAALEKFVQTGKLELKEYSNAKLEAFASRVSNQGGATQSDFDEAALQAMRDKISAQRIDNALILQYKDTLRDIAKSKDSDYISTLSTSRQQEELNRLVKIYSSELDEAYSRNDKKAVIDATKMVADAEHQLFELQHSVATAGQTMRESFSSAFSSLGDDIAEFVATGEFNLKNFTDTIVKSVISTMVQLAVINPILNGLFGGASGWKALPSIFGSGPAVAGAKAGGGPVDSGSTYFVGEDGPELFTPRASGTIIPNDRLGAMTLSTPTSVYNFTYNIPAGITRADLIPILRMQEKHTLTALRDRQRRGKA